MNNQQVWLSMFRNTMQNGRILSPRGQRIREIEDLQIEVNPDFPFMNFHARRYDINYFKQEMKWKLGADKYDESIKAHAKMWESVQNPDGTFNSNYGQFWFGSQMGFMKVVLELLRDPDSRRAVIPMLADHHMDPGVKDTVCTECVGFRIRDNVLNMSVHMRSSDQVFGLGTDIPTFAMLFRMVLGMLIDTYPTLMPGKIKITAMSSHIYERHFKMVQDIIDGGTQGYDEVGMPYFLNSSEVLRLIADRGNHHLRQSNVGDFIWVK